MSQYKTSFAEDSFAIVGMGMRFPGEIDSPEKLWDCLKTRRCTITEVPPDRWDHATFYHPDQERVGKTVSKWASIVKDIESFDAGFFHISPREASFMDPQQRLVLMTTWEAFEDAGIDPEKEAERTGVFMGVGMMDYPVLLSEDAHLMGTMYSNTGFAHSAVSNRVSFVWGLKGPSYTVDTACSSALTALHAAYKALVAGECDIAVVGAVNVMVVPEVTCSFSAMGVMAPDGCSRPFSKEAHGYVRAEGFGSLILKKASRAVADGDHIYCVVGGTRAGHVGHSASITMPDLDAERDMILECYKELKVDPSQVVYVEAHGTGTPVGDPIEAKAIAVALRAERNKELPPLPIGSVKGNLGHQECCSGLAAVMKCALQLTHRAIMPTANFLGPNPDIDFENLRIRPVTDIEIIPEKDKPIMMGVNSFGFVGSLAHVILEEAPKPKIPTVLAPTAGWHFGGEDSGLPVLVVLSAKVKPSLVGLAQKWLEYTNLKVDANLVSAWSRVRRYHFDGPRISIVATNSKDFRTQLRSFIAKEANADPNAKVPPLPTSTKLCFVFTGQGQQWSGMGSSLYKTQPVFREYIDKCDAIFKKYSGWSLLDRGLFGAKPIPQDNPLDMSNALTTQPAILFFQIALYHLWLSIGIVPKVVVGHSLGEVGAAYAGGRLSLEQSIYKIWVRSQEQVKTKGSGKMCSLRVANLEEVPVLLSSFKSLYVAAHNSPSSVTLAGSAEDIEAICAQNPDKSRLLDIPSAYHTRFMDPIKEPFLTNFAKVQFPANVPPPDAPAVYSTVTGDKYDGAFDGEYWWKNIRQSVLFKEAIESIMRDEAPDVFLEISATKTLPGPIYQSMTSDQRKTRVIISSIERKEVGEDFNLLDALGKLYVFGVPIQWGLLGKGVHTYLPTYAWNYAKFWQEATSRHTRRLGLVEKTYSARKGDISLDDFPLLSDHVIQKKIVVPGAAYVEYTLETYFEGSQNALLKDIKFLEVCVFPDVAKPAVSLSTSINGDKFSVLSSGGRTHCSGTVTKTTPSSPAIADVSVLKAEATKELNSTEIYAYLVETGFSYGKEFQVLKSVSAGDCFAIGHFVPPPDAAQKFHTVILDGCLQLAFFLSENAYGATFVPVRIASLELFCEKVPQVETYAIAKLTDSGPQYFTADIQLYTTENNAPRLLAELKGYRAEDIDSERRSTDEVIADLGQSAVYRTIYEDKGVDPSIIPHVTKALNSNQFPEDEAEVKAIVDRLPWLMWACVKYVQIALAKNTDPSKLCDRPRYHERIRDLAAIPTIDDSREFTLEDIAKKLDEIDKEIPQFAIEMRMLRRLGEELAVTMCDPHHAVPILFAPESFAAFFAGCPSVTIFYKMIAQSAAEAIVRIAKTQHIIRVMEIGGRMGGFTRHLLGHPLLKDLEDAGRLHYVFTDGEDFFPHAKQALAAYPFVKFQVFDLELGIVEQNFVAGSMDIVIVIDTIHSVHHARATLEKLHDFLVPGGPLYILEPTNSRGFSEVMFGSLALCWAWTDDRVGNCWLNQTGWKTRMEQHGFDNVACYTSPGEFMHSVMLGFRKWDFDSKNLQLTNWVVYAEPATQELASGVIENKKSTVRSLQTIEEWRTHVTEAGGKDAGILVVLPANYVDATHSILDLFHGIQGSQILPGGVWILSPPSLSTSAHQNGHAHPNGQANGHQNGHVNGSTAKQLTREEEQAELAAFTSAGMARVAVNEILSVPVYYADSSAFVGGKKELSVAVKNWITGIYGREREIYINGLPEPKIGKANYTVPRLVTASVEVADGSTHEHYRLEATHDGKVQFFAIIPVDKLQSGEVRISVRASSLNFKDVMLALGLLDELENEPFLGFECAGVISEIGPDVTSFAVGDEVIAFGKHTFSDTIVTNSEVVFKKPKNLNFAEAAAVGIAYITAYYCLVGKARVTEEDVVLIHSAMGGVGQAAIAICKMIGAKVIATVGSAGKRKRLTDEYGIEWVTDSHNTETFTKDVLAWTKGKGVDVVLNSLAGPAQKASLQLLAPGGRFCEIGKRDILENGSMELGKFLHNISFLSVHVDMLMKENPRVYGRVMREVLSLIESGQLSLFEVHAHPITEAPAIFKLMSTGTHTGKLVLEIPKGKLHDVKINAPSTVFRADATYILIGGNGGLGQAISRWMADQGVRHIVIISRSLPRTGRAILTVQHLRQQGVQVHTLAVDASNKNALREAIVNVSAKVPPIKGIFHLATTVHDINLSSMTPYMLDSVLNAKAQSAWNIHELSVELKLDLEIFVVFSSLSNVLGFPEQANYSAANEFLDGVVSIRKKLGLPALALQLGTIKGAGFLELSKDTMEIVKLRGLEPIHMVHVLAFIQHLLKTKEDTVCISLHNSALYSSYVNRFNTTKYDHLIPLSQLKLAAAAAGELSEDVVRATVMRKLAIFLGSKEEDIVSDKSLMEQGVDSLISTQLVRFFQQELGLTVSHLDILGGISLDELLAHCLAGSVGMVPPPTATTPIPAHV